MRKPRELGKRTGVSRRRLARIFRNQEDGVAALETAIVMPLLMMVLFGMLFGGILLYRWITLSDAARETTRFGATLPVETTTSDWLDAVVDRAVNSSNGELAASHADRSICVALVGTDTDAKWENGTESTGTCFTDGRPTEEPRVQVEVSRQGEWDAVFWSRMLTLDGRAVARYEVQS